MITEERLREIEAMVSAPYTTPNDFDARIRPALTELVAAVREAREAPELPADWRERAVEILPSKPLKAQKLYILGFSDCRAGLVANDRPND